MDIIDPAAASIRASIREMGENIVQIHLSGDHTKALNMAEDLHRKHQDSPMAVILIADLLREAARRVDSMDLKDRLNQDAVDAYRKAARMLPFCIDTQVCYGEMLSEIGMYEMAEIILTSALDKQNPIDPAENILTYGISRPLRSTSERRIRDVIKRAMQARQNNREGLSLIINSKVEQVMAIEKHNVALKRAQSLASMYPLSVRVHLLHAHMEMELAYILPVRVNKASLRRALGVLDKVDESKICDLQRSAVVFLFRAKLQYLLREYALAENLCNHGLMIKDPEDPALEDIPPGSFWGCDGEERISSCRAQLRSMLVKLVTESIIFCLTPSSQQEMVFSFSLSSLMKQYCDSSDALKTLTCAEKQFHLNNTTFTWLCPHCNRRNLPSPVALLQHLFSKHITHIPQTEVLENLVKGFEGNATEMDWPSDQLVYDPDKMVFRFEDVFSAIKAVTESHLQISSADCLHKKRLEAAKILEKMQEELISLPTSGIESTNAYSEVIRAWETLKKVCKLDLLLPLARITVWRDILMQMSVEAKGSSWDVTAADMERVLNTQNEVPSFIEDKPEVSDEGTDNEDKSRNSQSFKRSSDSSAKEEPTFSYKGHRSKPNALEKKLLCIKEFLHESSIEDHGILMILHFLFSMSTFRDEVLRGCLDSEQEVRLRGAIYEIFSDWRKQQFSRMSEFVSSFREYLAQACNDSASFPQVRQAYASEAVAMVLKRLSVSIPSTLGIKMLLKSQCDCRRSDESIMLMLKFDTKCTQKSQVTSFSELTVLYEKPHQCFDCGNTEVIDVVITQMPPCLQIVLDWSTGGSPSSLYELMAKLDSAQEVSFFHQGLLSEMKYKLKAMICWSKGLYVFFGRENKRWLIFDKTTAKTHSWSQILEIYGSGNLLPEILCFESTWSGPPDIFHPEKKTTTDQDIHPTLQQHFRSSAGKSRMRMEEDGGEEERLHLSFKEKMNECSADEVPCLSCHLKGERVNPMDINHMPKHCKQFHGGAGIKCSKHGCHVRGSNRGQIGKHELYCHR